MPPQPKIIIPSYNQAVRERMKKANRWLASDIALIEEVFEQSYAIPEDLIEDTHHNTDLMVELIKKGKMAKDVPQRVSLRTRDYKWFDPKNENRKPWDVCFRWAVPGGGKTEFQLIVEEGWAHPLLSTFRRPNEPADARASVWRILNEALLRKFLLPAIRTPADLYNWRYIVNWCQDHGIHVEHHINFVYGSVDGQVGRTNKPDKTEFLAFNVLSVEAVVPGFIMAANHKPALKVIK